MAISKKIKINDVEYDSTTYDSETFRRLMIESFGDSVFEKNVGCSVEWDNVDGYCVSLKSNSDDPYMVEICDESGTVIYSAELKSGMFAKTARKYYTEWSSRVYNLDRSDKICESSLNLEGSRVFIVFESSSLGDTLAWVPYCEEFRKKHNCHVIVSTFRNDMFEGMYPDLEFVSPGSVVYDLKALYRLGWFYDKEKEPVLPSTIPLQKSATNILGLEFREIRPRLSFAPGERPIDQKYVTIGMSTTAGCKEWSYPGGWQKLIDYLNSVGYKVAVIQKEDFSGIDGVLDWTGDKSLKERMNQIHHSEFYIGLGSGLSWLAWAVGKHVVMISNFSEEGHEFVENTTRITNKSVCNGCWNNPMFKFDKGDWYWCPEHKGTERQFECHTSISPQMVIDKIQHLIK
jgi:autotransporter strand-loop-strand O-heptosyltransferase